jgi:hypothetical protein
METRQIYSVIVGIDRYKGLSTLTCATNDATDVAEVLRVGTDSSQIKLLTNAVATKRAILQRLTWLSRKAGPRDTAIVYFSGHGGRRSSPLDDQAYFCPSDASAEDLEGTCIVSGEFTAALRAIKSERLVVLLDTCYAGGLGEARSKEAGLDAGLNGKDVNGLIEGRGRVIMAASGPYERAWELREERNGRFTTYLLQALRGEVARPDGTIWMSDVFSYVSRFLRDKDQHPYQKAIGEDFVLTVQPRAIRSKVRPASEGAEPPEIDQRLLRRAMRSAYNRAEVEILCQDLGMSIEDLSDHRPIEAQIMELIDHCHRHRLYNKLLERVRADRPHLARFQS